jgi:DNA polymerase-4
MAAYSEASKAVFAVFEDTTPLVEGLSIDEAFLDTRGMERLAGTPAEIAVRLRRQVRERVGLPITVGVARTKFLAKVASAVSKPDGLLLVEPDREQEFLHPLPVTRLWGVGAATAEKLHRLNIHTVGELAELEAATAERLLGRAAGAHLHALARLRDPRPVNPTTRRRSIGSQRALGRRPRGMDELDLVLTQIVDRLGRELLASAQPLITERGITLIGLSLGGLRRAGDLQPELPIDWGEGARLDAALDAVRGRFGSAAVSRAAQLGRDEGWTAPVLPEHR